jgi:hypothetical protein
MLRQESGFGQGRELTSCAETCYYTSDEDEIRTLSGGLQSSSHKSEDSSVEETVDTSDPIGGPTTYETSDNSAEIVL